MSSPYGQQPYGQQPYGYGQPQMPMPNQYGQPYGQQPPYGYGQPPTGKPHEVDMTNVNVSNNTKPIDDFKKSKIEFNEKPKYQDVWATLLYLLTLGVTIVLGVIGIPHINMNNMYSTNDIKKTNGSYSSTSSGYNNHHYGNGYYKRSASGKSFTDIVIMIGASLGAAALMTLLYMTLVQKFTGKMIKGTFIISIIMNFVYAGIALVFKSFILGIIMIIGAFLYMLCYFFWRKRIPFAKVMLKTVTTVTKKFPATIFVGFLGCVVAALWYGFIALTLVGAITYIRTEINEGAAYVAYVFLIFSFFFTSQVINNFVHVTISGVFATYYFRGVNEPGTNKIEVDVRNPTLKSFNRAATTSFGSICFGSLLIALVSTLRVLANQAKQEAAEDENYLLCLIACCVECILSCIEDGIEYFNIYAFTEVAIYGKPYCQAAKDTWTLCKARGIEALINDNIIGNVLSIGALAVGFLSVIVTFAVGLFIGIKDAAALSIYGVIAFLIGCMVFSVVAQVINSGVATTFVCLCEDPDALRQTKPELWEKVRDTYPSIVY
ncbi:DUF580-domain-containing protein [Anaeromyces robustus]|uniref:Protein PNS1 n=1 Tax=Anaeromyces robustus TaxID=1754192 RepID=A0A1Y1XKS7_9FUNG|nr:DUF580-domain-containing protein [Anaeromyces robustus]|eukprot:ORX86358.1 DUF580-domain-containing protein [Anaeromyces robustus]